MKPPMIPIWHNNCSTQSVAGTSTVLSRFEKKLCLIVASLRKGEKVMDEISATNTASDIQMDYMKLLITQLQNQNPLEPLDNSDMASQLAQFSQLQQLEAMNSSFAEILATAERTYANSLIGKEVTFTSETETGSTETTSGVVEQVINDSDGEVLLVVGDHTLALDDVISVKE